jgi:hypothetical protein
VTPQRLREIGLNGEISDSLFDELVQLRSLATEILECFEDAAPYAGEYLVWKFGYPEDIARFRAALGLPSVAGLGTPPETFSTQGLDI